MMSLASARTASSPSGSRRNASLISASAISTAIVQRERQPRLVGQPNRVTRTRPAARRSPRCCRARRRAGGGRPRRRSAGSGSRARCGACRCTRRWPRRPRPTSCRDRRRRCAGREALHVRVEVAQGQRLDDRPLVREELVDRADGDPGPLGEQGRGQPVVADLVDRARRRRRACGAPGPGCAPAPAPAAVGPPAPASLRHHRALIVPCVPATSSYPHGQ